MTSLIGPYSNGVSIQQFANANVIHQVETVVGSPFPVVSPMNHRPRPLEAAPRDAESYSVLPTDVLKGNLVDFYV